MDINNIINLKYNKDEIKAKRYIVRNELIKKSMNIYDGAIKSISNLDLKILFYLYDKYFFDNYFKENIENEIKFSLSKRMTRAAGKTIFQKAISNPNNEKYEIRMGIDFFLNYYDVIGEKKVSGINTKDSLHAFMIVFEHEICHLIEFHVFKNSNCSAKRFKTIAYNVFGHTESYHQLPTNDRIAFEKFGIKIGDVVNFTNDRKKYSGILYKINKRATVMVFDKNGDYKDKVGNSYTKWYVPVERLEK